MTKIQFDHYFTKNYNDLIQYTDKAIKHFKRRIDTIWVLSECYLYVLDLINSINSESQVVSYSKNWIKTNLRWNNTPIMREANIKSNNNDILYYHSVTNTPDSSIILDKIEEFRDTLSTYDRRLFNMWWDLDLRKGKDISEHLDISISGSYNILNQCKELDMRLEIFIKKNII